MERFNLLNMEHVMPKHRPKNNAATNALWKAILLLACLVFGGIALYNHFDAGNTEPAPPYALQLRPDYPVSSFIYKRGFLWFIGLVATVAGTGVALAALYPACVAVTSGLGAAGCALAATAVVTTVIGIAATRKAGITRRRYHLAQQSMLYMDWVDKSSKAAIDRKVAEMFDTDYDPAAADREIAQIFGNTYKFEGLITADDHVNRDLYIKHGGAVPVFSFTAPNGLKFHHAMVPDEHTSFHRFAVVNSNSNVKSRRQATQYKSAEHFKNGGLDMQDCADSLASQQRLNQGDNNEMAQQIHCNDPNLGMAKEIAVQIYDSATHETIGAGKVAPFNADGTSRIFTDNSCPTRLPAKNCGQEPSNA